MKKDLSWQKGPHADAIYMLREAAQKAFDEASRIVECGMHVDSVFGPAGTARLLEGTGYPHIGAMADEARLRGHALQESAQVLMALGAPTPTDGTP